jgi:hypothetical protein
MLEGPPTRPHAPKGMRGEAPPQPTDDAHRNQPAPSTLSVKQCTFAHRCYAILRALPWRPLSARAAPHPTEVANKAGPQHASPPPPWRSPTLPWKASAQAEDLSSSRTTAWALHLDDCHRTTIIKPPPKVPQYMSIFDHK